MLWMQWSVYLWEVASFVWRSVRIWFTRSIGVSPCFLWYTISLHISFDNGVLQRRWGNASRTYLMNAGTTPSSGQPLGPGGRSFALSLCRRSHATTTTMTTVTNVVVLSKNDTNPYTSWTSMLFVWNCSTDTNNTKACLIRRLLYWRFMHDIKDIV